MNRKTRKASTLISHSPSGNVIYVPKRTVIQTSRGRRPPKTSNKKKKKSFVIGRMVAARNPAPDAAVIYGRARVGGVYSYLSTNKDTQAYYRTGEDNSQIVWIARVKGSAGNQITLTFELGNTLTTSVEVTNKAILVKLKRSGAESRATANDVISAIRANSDSNRLVSVHKGEGTGVDYVDILAETPLQDGGGTQLHHFITIAGHEIDKVENLFLDDDQVKFGARPDPRWATSRWAKRVFMAVQYGTNSQEAQPDLVEFVGEQRWTVNHRQRGCAGVYLKTVYQSNLFPNGIPDVEFLVRGKKCFDFRDNQTRWTSNAALILADFLTDEKIGCGIPLAHLNSANWIDAANTCDELVNLASGGTERRYSINGTFDTGSSSSTIVEEMLQAMAGDLVYQGGEWFCYPGKHRAPSWAIDEADLREEIKIKTAIPRKDRFNAVKGSFVNPAEKYTEDDYAAVKNSFYSDQDGQVIFEDIPQPFVTSNAQAQRIAKIELERVRQGIEVDLVLGGSALGMTVCDVVTLSYERFGWNSKQFEIRDIKISDDTENGITVTLKLRETSDAIYVWSAEETEKDIAPDTSLPSPFDVLPPTNITLTSGTSELYIRNDGTIFARMKVSWTKPDDQYVLDGGRYDLQYKRVVDQNWVAVSPIDGDQNATWILDVQDSQRYLVRIRSVNTIGVSSDWVESLDHLVVGKSAPPSNVPEFSAVVQENGILILWSKVGDLDVKEYEIRSGTSWDTASPIVRTLSSSYVWNVRTSGSYNLMIKALDTSGNYSSSASVASVTIPKPSASQMHWEVVGQDVVLRWTKSEGPFAVDNYRILYGSSPSTAETLANVNALTYRFKANWSGSRNFYVRATDVAGNSSDPGELQIQILLPNRPANLAASVVDNNVLFRWDDPPLTSLPIISYELKKGPTFELAEMVGNITSTFTTHFELQSGTYNYYLVTIDSAGNASPPSMITATVDQPPDFQFLGSHDFNFEADIESTSDAVPIDKTTILFPVSNNSWADHFGANGWTTFQDQFSAGYNYLVVPNDTGGSVILFYDFGAVIESAAVITLTYLTTTISGTVTVTPTMSVSENGTIWQNLTPGSTREFASNVRFIRVLFDAVSEDEHGLATLSGVSIQLGIKEGALSGKSETDNTGQKTISIAGYFADVNSIIVTPGYKAAYPVVAVYDFIDEANPTSFTVHTYRADNGDAVGNVSFSYNLRGTLA